MRTAQQLKTLGVESWFHQHANQYVRLLENAGWSDKQIDGAIRFGVNFKGGTEAELMQQFREMGEYVSAPELDLVTHAAMGVRDTILTDGLESLPPLPLPSFTGADQKRLDEIREEIRNDPHAADRLQGEQLALLEAQQASGRKAAPSAPVAPAATPAAPAAPSGDRLAELRAMSRNDPDGYNRNPALAQEALGLIEASLPKSAPVSTDSASPTSATADAAPTQSGDS